MEKIFLGIKMNFLIIFLILLSQQEVFCENEDSVEHLDSTTSPETKQITTIQTDSEAFKDVSTVRTSTIKESMLETKTNSDETTSDKTAADKRTSDDTTSNEMPSDEIISDGITSEEATQRNLDEKALNYTTSEEPITEETSSVKRSTFNVPMVETRTNSYETTSEQVTADERTSNELSSDEFRSDETTQGNVNEKVLDEIISDLIIPDETTSNKITSDEITSNETTPNILDDQEVTNAYTTESGTKTPDHVKQNILKMFNNLLTPEIMNKEETTIDTDESTRTFTTPMTTPSGKNPVTPKSVITTMSGKTTSGLLHVDTIKVSTISEDITTVKMTTLPTLGDTITSTVQSRNIETKPTTFITIPTTAQSTIKDMETTSNYIKTTTMNNEMLSITSTGLTMPKAMLTQNTNMDIIMTTSEEPYMKTTEEVKYNIKEKEVDLSTIISEAEDFSNTTSEDTKEEQTTAKETPEEMTTDWFYPTTKPVTAALYRTIQEVPFKNQENLDQHLLPKRKKTLTRIPWIFPQWVSGQKLDPYQNPYPRRIQL